MKCANPKPEVAHGTNTRTPLLTEKWGFPFFIGIFKKKFHFGEGTPYVPPYMLAVGAGYLDAWLEQKTYDEGYTSGFDETISNPFDTLETRIDLILLDPSDLEIDKVKGKVVGDKIGDMVSNDYYLAPPGALLWPSDHAGVVAKIKFSKPHWPWWKKFRWSPK